MRVTVRGVTYESVKECAKALGVTDVTVYSAISRGKADTIGVGAGRGPKINGTHRGGRPRKPVTFYGVTFPSMAAASRALGMSTHYVYRTLHEGGEEARQNLMVRAMQYVAKKNREEAEGKA